MENQEIDYTELILRGKYSDAGIKYLKDFLFREMQRCNKVDVTNNEFIAGCKCALLNLINELDNHKRFAEDKLNTELSAYKKDIEDFENIKTPDEQQKSKVANSKMMFIKTDIKLNQIQNDFYIKFNKLHINEYNSIIISYSDIDKIKEAINYLESKTVKISTPTLKTLYNKEQLTTIHNKAVENGFIESDIDSWLHWFSGIYYKTPRKIKWIYKDGNKKEPNKSALTYFIEKLTGEILYSTSNKIFDIKILTKNKYLYTFDDIENLFKEITDI